MKKNYTTILVFLFCLIASLTSEAAVQYLELEVSKLRAIDAAIDGNKQLNWGTEDDPGNFTGVTWVSTTLPTGGKYLTVSKIIIPSKQLSGSLDFSDFFYVEYVWVYDNNLTSINADNCYRLENLLCFDNVLTTCEVNVSKLKIFNCKNNQLTILNLGNGTNLTQLDCSDNKLNSLNVDGLTSLQHLRLNGNNIPLSELPLPSANYLTYEYSPQNLVFEEHTEYLGYTIDYSSENFVNGIASSFQWSKNGAAYPKTIKSKYKPVEEGVYCCGMVNTTFPGLIIITNDVTIISDPNDQNGDGLFDADVQALHELRANHTQLQALWELGDEANWNGISWSEVDSPKRLTAINISEQELTGSIDFTGFSNVPITNINLSYNELESINLNGVVNLSVLNAVSNKLLTLNLSGCLKLKEVSVHHNYLKSLDLSGINLTKLSCTFNRIPMSELPLPGTIDDYGYNFQYAILPKEDEEVGAILSYPSEEIINMEQSAYQWYKDNSELAGETGMTLKTSTYGIGKYKCKMLNVTFPNLLMCFTAEINVIANSNPNDQNGDGLYDSDVQALHELRANHIQLQEMWELGDEANWSGISWSEADSPKRLTVISIFDIYLAGNIDFTGFNGVPTIDINISSNRLETCDVSGLHLHSLKCNSNYLTDINLSGTILTELNCTYNDIPMSRLPLPGTIENYWYDHQFDLLPKEDVEVGTVLSYPSEEVINMQSSSYQWYKDNDELEGETGLTLETSTYGEGMYYCLMSNPTFPDIEECSTSPVKVIKKEQLFSETASPVYTHEYKDTTVAEVLTLSSGLSINYVILSGNSVEIIDDAYHIVGVGKTRIRLYHDGNIQYQPVEKIITWSISKAGAPINEMDDLVASLGESPIVLNASNSQDFPMIYTSSDNSVARIDGNTVYLENIGTATITVNHQGNDNYLGDEVSFTIEVVEEEKKNQEIENFEDLTVLITEGLVELNATATSGLDLIYSASNNIVSIEGNVVSFIESGTVEITARQNGDANYYSAEKLITLTINKAEQTFNDFEDLTVNDNNEPIAIELVSDQGVELSYSSSNNDVVKLEGNSLVFKGIGEAQLTVANNGTNLYLPFEKTINVVVSEHELQTQSILNFSDTVCCVSETQLVFNAESSAGLEVQYSASSQLVSFTGNVAQINGAGVVEITASQVGNDEYLATAKTISMTIQKSVQGLDSFDDMIVTFGDGTIVLPETTDAGLAIVYAVDNNLAAILKENQIEINGAGEVHIEATQVGDEMYAEFTATITLTINKASQYIDEMDNREVDLSEGKIEIVPIISSGLEPTILSVDTEVASIDGSTILLHNTGSVTIKVEQAGNENYLPAETVSFILSIDDKTDIELTKLEAFKVYPNPSKGIVNIDCAGGETIYIYNNVGQCVKACQFDDISKNTLDLSQLKAGVYQLIIRDDSHSVSRIITLVD